MNFTVLKKMTHVETSNSYTKKKTFTTIFMTSSPAADCGVNGNHDANVDHGVVTTVYEQRFLLQSHQHKYGYTSMYAADA